MSILFFIYPFAASKYHQTVQQKVANKYQEEVVNKDQQSLEKIKQSLTEHNAEVADVQSGMTVNDFGIEAERSLQEQGAEGASREDLGEVIAVLEIPKIRLELPVYYGTNNKQISNGAGVMKETSLPFGGKSTHSVITSHRGLPTAKLFTDLPKLELKDNFFMKIANETHAYEVDQIKVIEPDDYDELQIVPGEDYITLLTCTPYMVNSHRILVRGKRITPYSPSIRRQEEQKGRWIWLQHMVWWVLGIVTLVVLFFLKRHFSKKKKQKR